MLPSTVQQLRAARQTGLTIGHSMGYVAGNTSLSANFSPLTKVSARIDKRKDGIKTHAIDRLVSQDSHGEHPSVGRLKVDGFDTRRTAIRLDLVHLLHCVASVQSVMLSIAMLASSGGACVRGGEAMSTH